MSDTYVLRETLASERAGQPVWFQAMTAIGPCATRNRAARAVFASADEANRCPALWHPLSFYEIEEAT